MFRWRHSITTILRAVLIVALVVFFASPPAFAGGNGDRHDRNPAVQPPVTNPQGGNAGGSSGDHQNHGRNGDHGQGNANGDGNGHAKPHPTPPGDRGDDDGHPGKPITPTVHSTNTAVPTATATPTSVPQSTMTPTATPSDDSNAPAISPGDSPTETASPAVPPSPDDGEPNDVNRPGSQGTAPPSLSPTGTATRTAAATPTATAETMVLSTLHSDDFTADQTLNPKWTFYGGGASSAFVDPTESKGLRIAVDTSRPRTCWVATLDCVRLMESAPAGDFQVTMRLDTLPPLGATGAHSIGIMAYQDSHNYARFEIQSDKNSSAWRITADEFVNDVGYPDMATCENLVALTAPVYLRVDRVSGNWTLAYSTDGTVYQRCGAFSQDLSVTQVGPEVQNDDNLVTFTHADVGYFHLRTRAEETYSPTPTPPATATAVPPSTPTPLPATPAPALPPGTETLLWTKTFVASG